MRTSSTTPLLPALLSIAMLASGSLLVAPATAVSAEVAPTTADPRVVVAVIDTPLNPYHDWFHAGGPVYGEEAPSSVTPEVLDELGIDDDHIIRLTRTGDWQADYATDQAQFDAAQPGELYWYEGTNVIATYFANEDQDSLLPQEPDASHGTATSAAVLAANPEAIVLSVSPWSAGRLEEATFVQTLPAVDIVNTSFGAVFGIPYPLHAGHSYEGVVGNGKLHFGAAGNFPTPDLWSHGGGPWWLIGVGGYDEREQPTEEEGQFIDAATAPDFMGDYEQVLPVCGQCESGTETWSGTSFSSPRAAGTASRVLLEARRAAGHLGGIVTDGVSQPAMVHAGGTTITNWELRRALEEAAWVPEEPILDGSASLPPSHLPVNGDYPWPQVGWGVLTPVEDRGVVGQALSHLGLGEEPMRRKPAEACEFMTANQESRRLWWDNLYTSDSFGRDAYPYIAC